MSPEDPQLLDRLLPWLQFQIPAGVYLYCSMRGCRRRGIRRVPQAGALGRAASVSALVDRERRRACAEFIRAGWGCRRGPVCPSCRAKLQRRLAKPPAATEAGFVGTGTEHDSACG